jgi:hypothetical protein
MGTSDNIFNTRIDNLPVSSNSATYIAALPATTPVRFTPSWGLNYEDNTTPTTTFLFRYTPENNGLTFLLPVWPSLKRESGVFSNPFTGSPGVDRHIMGVNYQTCKVYEIYNNYPLTGGYTAQSGIVYDSTTYALPTPASTSASGMPLLMITMTLDDIRSGVIKHALDMTMAPGFLASSYIWPATAFASDGGTVPFGNRLRLKASFDISSFSATAQIILTAMKNYGLFLADGGTDWDIITSTDVTLDRNIQAAMLEIQTSGATPSKNDFEVVDESSLMVNALSAQVLPTNAYVTPPAFAVIQADNGVDPITSEPISLQGVGVSSPDGGGVWIQPGISYQLTVPVSGTTNYGVTWAMSPVVGSLNPTSGVYVGPSVSVPTTTNVTATSIADSSRSVTFPVTVMPAGVIRIDVGNATANPSAPNSNAPDYGPDTNGFMWWRDQAGERGWGVNNDYYYPPSSWPVFSNIYLYQTQWYNEGDSVYKFVVPNGNYTIDYFVGQGGCGGTSIPYYNYLEHLESQGILQIQNLNPLPNTGFNCFEPYHYAIPALVTNNQIYFALRRITNISGPQTVPVTIMSAFSISPVSSFGLISKGPEFKGPVYLK